MVDREGFLREKAPYSNEPSPPTTNTMLVPMPTPIRMENRVQAKVFRRLVTTAQQQRQEAYPSEAIPPCCALRDSWADHRLRWEGALVSFPRHPLVDRMFRWTTETATTIATITTTTTMADPTETMSGKITRVFAMEPAGIILPRPEPNLVLLAGAAALWVDNRDPEFPSRVILPCLVRPDS